MERRRLGVVMACVLALVLLGAVMASAQVDLTPSKTLVKSLGSRTFVLMPDAIDAGVWYYLLLTPSVVDKKGLPAIELEFYQEPDPANRERERCGYVLDVELDYAATPAEKSLLSAGLTDWVSRGQLHSPLISRNQKAPMKFTGARKLVALPFHIADVGLPFGKYEFGPAPELGFDATKAKVKISGEDKLAIDVLRSMLLEKTLPLSLRVQFAGALPVSEFAAEYNPAKLVAGFFANPTARDRLMRVTWAMNTGVDPVKLAPARVADIIKAGGLTAPADSTGSGKGRKLTVEESLSVLHSLTEAVFTRQPMPVRLGDVTLKTEGNKIPFIKLPDGLSLGQMLQAPQHPVDESKKLRYRNIAVCNTAFVIGVPLSLAKLDQAKKDKLVHLRPRVETHRAMFYLPTVGDHPALASLKDVSFDMVMVDSTKLDQSRKPGTPPPPIDASARLTAVYDFAKRKWLDGKGQEISGIEYDFTAIHQKMGAQAKNLRWITTVKLTADRYAVVTECENPVVDGVFPLRHPMALLQTVDVEPSLLAENEAIEKIEFVVVTETGEKLPGPTIERKDFMSGQQQCVFFPGERFKCQVTVFFGGGETVVKEFDETYGYSIVLEPGQFVDKNPQ